MNRIEALKRVLLGSPAIISRPDHVRYLTGVDVREGSVVIVSESKTVLVGARSCVAQGCGGMEYVGYDDSPDVSAHDQLCEVVASYTQSLKSHQIFAEPKHLGPIAPALERFATQDVEPLLLSLRRRKDPDELQTICHNLAVNELAFQAIPYLLQRGSSTERMYQEIHTLFDVLTDHRALLDGCVGAGTLSADPDAQPGNEPLMAGDSVFVDLYPKIDGYYSDITRAYCIESPTAKQVDVFRTLTACLNGVEGILRPGLPCSQVDRLVRQIMKCHGYEDFFPHHTGHGVGLEQQEPPYITKDSQDILQEGDVIAIEPGIYIPGWGGMRLESLYFISSTGAERLDTVSRDLVSVEGAQHVYHTM